MEIIISQETNPKKRTTQRTASSQRSASGQRTASAQRSASSQRSTSAQRTASGQRPVNGQRTANGQRPVNQQVRRRKKKKTVSPILITLLVALALAIGVFAGLGVYAARYTNYDKILPNVYVAGIDVGGMTQEEAVATIEAELESSTQRSLSVILPDKALTFAPQQDTVVIDVDQAVAEAYAYGRTRTSPFAMARAIKAAQRTRNDIDISTAVQIDTDYIQSIINDTAAEVDTALVESTVVTDPDAHTITVTIGSPGRSIDTEELYELVSTAFVNGDYSDIDFDYDMVYPATIQLDSIYSEMTVEAKNAAYDVSTKDVTAEEVGYEPTTELDKANEALALASPGDVLTFTFEETQPEVTAEELQALLFRDTLASYASAYTSNWGRTENLRLACEAINGTVLQPGSVFSFNEIVGERTADKGYQEATVYVSGQSKAELGGGVCQVASTIYYCAMYADLEIVERTEHQFTVDYVPGGLDATVYYGQLDFQFRNDTDYPIQVNAYLSGGKCHIELIGTNITGQYCKIDSELVSTTPFETIETNDADEVQSGYTGKVYTITRYVYAQDGSLIRTDTTADLDAQTPSLGTSTYSKRDKYVYNAYAGITTTTPTTEPSEDPTSTPTTEPTTAPTTAPSTEPTAAPTTEPTVEPTTAPTVEPTPEEPAPAAEVPDVSTGENVPD